MPSNSPGSIFNDISGSLGSQGSWIFDGTDDYIRLTTIANMRPSEAELNATGFTINAWINSDSAATYQGVFCNDGAMQTDYYGLETTIGATGNFTMHKMDGGFPSTGNRKSLVSSIPVVPGAWTYVTYNFVTADNADWIIYINGVDKSAGTSGTGGNIAYNPSGHGGIGIRLVTPFDGKISNVQIYNRSLSQDEVLQNYNVQKSRFGL